MRELVIAAFQTGGASVIVLGLAMVVTKVLAVVVGPTGIGLASLARQTYQSALILATLNGQTAMAQGIAGRDERARGEYLVAVIWVLLIGGGTAALAFLLFPSQIAVFVMGREDHASVQLIRWLSFAILAGVCSTFLTGVLAGHRAIGRIALLQIIGAGVAVMLVYPVALLLRAGYSLALAFQLALPAVAMSAVGLVFVVRGGWAPKRSPHMGLLFNSGAAMGFLRLAGAMLLSGFLATSTPLAVRAIAVRRFGLPGVGTFDVAWTISMNYVLLAVASFSTYYVPSLSRLKESRDRQELIHQVLRLSMVLMVPLVVTTTVLKSGVVRALYSPAFLPALAIMRWMLIGDYFKVTSWVFSFTMIAYADVKTLVWTEIVWGGLSVGGAALAILHLNSLSGVGASFLFVYATYLIFTLFYVGSRRHFALDGPTTATWLIGLALILAAAAQTWSDTQVRPVLAMAYVGAAAYFSWAALTTEEKRRIRNPLYRVLGPVRSYGAKVLRGEGGGGQQAARAGRLESPPRLLAHDPLVTVCMPSFNHARFLPAAIQSVLAQTYRNIELIIVDDGSTDGSLEIAQGFALRYPKQVKVFVHDDHARRGISATANLAFQKSSGRYWCGLSSDDAFVADKVERQVAFLERHPDIGILYGRVIAIDENGRKLGQVFVRDLSRERDPLRRLLEGNCIYGQTLMLRRECFENVGLHDETLIYSDWELWVRIVAHYKIAFLARPVALYRVHGTNTSVGQPPEIQLERHLEVMSALERKVPAVGGALARSFNRALIELELAYLRFCASDRSAAALAIQAALKIDPSIFHDFPFLAGWLLRQQSRIASFTRSSNHDFLQWFAEQARPLASTLRQHDSPFRYRRLQFAVLCANYGLISRQVSRRAWFRMQPLLGRYVEGRAR